LENENSKKEFINGLVRSVKKKFPEKKPARELNETLSALKVHTLEKMIERILSSIDLDKLNSMNGEDIDDKTMVDIIYSGKKPPFGNITLRDPGLAVKVQSVLEKVQRVLLYELLQNNPEDRTKIISTVKGSVENIIYIEGGNAEDLERTKAFTSIPTQLSKDKTSPAETMDYWLRDPKILEKLYQLLLKEDLIEENLNFLYSFKVFSVKKEHRTTWKGHDRQLIYLMSFIHPALSVKHETIYQITSKLFINKNKQEFDPSKLNIALNQIQESIKLRKKLSKRLLKIEHLFNSVE
jgi:hypothetical protein